MANKLDKVKDEELLFIHTPTGIYYLRKRDKVSDTHISLKTTKIGVARGLRDDYLAARRARALGLAAPEPVKEEPKKEPPPPATVRDCLTRYKEDQYPDKRGNARGNGKHLTSETASVLKLDEFFGEVAVNTLSQNVLDNYHTHRCKQVNPKCDKESWDQGHRTTDLELVCLSNALNWAVRKEMIKQNPIASRIKYHQPSQARHAKEVAPQNCEELHAIVSEIFKNPRSASLGWQALYEANSGQRTEETLGLRMDAGPDEPGSIVGDSIRVRRAAKADRENPYCHIHPGLKVLLKAHRNWHKTQYPKSPWYFPGRANGGCKPASKCALTKLLAKLHEAGRIPRKITSHGMRGFFVLVRRSWGIGDSQIAWEINQIGGVQTLQQSYGGIPPHWVSGEGPKLRWLPKKPCWESLKRRQGRGGNTSGCH